MDNELWLKRWNTLKNFMNEQMKNVDMDDSEMFALQRVKNAMWQIEQMGEDNND